MSDDKNNKVTLSKSAELILSPFELDFKSKRIAAKLNDSLCKTSISLEGKFFKLVKEINSFGNDIVFASDYQVTFSEISNLSQIIKMLGFEIETENMTLNEKLLEYMHLCRELLGKELFVFVALKDYFLDDELKMLFHDMLAEKYNVLLLENVRRDCIDDIEKIRIIDKDLCEIY